MKRITTKQSRRNIKKRKAKGAARHAKSGTWTEPSRPMFGNGRVHYEVGGNTEAMSFGGIAPIHRLVTKLGLVSQIDSGLNLLKVHLPYHESDHVLNMAYNVLCGGTRLEDIARLRHDVAYMNALGADLIPDPTTAGDFNRRFSEADVLRLMEAINAVRPTLWQGRGAELLGPLTYMDIDGTIAPTCGECKAGMDISYKGIWGYAPLIISLANTKEVLYVVNRPGNAPSHKDAAEWIDRAVEHILPYTPRLCLRGDTDFSLTKHFDRWAEVADFIFGMDCSAALRTRTEALSESSWERLERKPKYETLMEETRQRCQRNEKEHIVKEREYANLHLKRNRDVYVRMEFRRVINSIVLIPCRVVRRARSIVVRIIGYHPTLDRLFSVWNTIERTGFA